MELLYFPVRARAEPIRMVLHYAKKSFTDTVVKGEAFAKLRADGELPTGQLPVLRAEGRTISQTMTIARYCASVSDSMPPTALEVARADELSETASDLMSFNPVVNMWPEDKAKEIATDAFQKCAKYLHFWSKSLGDKPFFHGDKPYYSDFMVWHVLDLALMLRPSILNDHGNLSAWVKRVAEQPGVKEYLASRAPLPQERLDVIAAIAT